MIDEDSDDCALCGDTIHDRFDYFRPPMEWTDYLREERGLGWFPHKAAVPVCGECYDRLYELKEARSMASVEGSERAVRLQEEIDTALESLDIESFVDESSI